MTIKQKTEALLSEVESTHRYSMSRIYSIYNEVFGTNETPQSCASCLIRKVKELRKWLETQKDEVKPTKSRKKKNKTE